MSYLVQMLVDALSSPSFLTTSLCLTGLVGACGCGHCGRNGSKNDDDDDEDENDSPDVSFNYSGKELEEYEQRIAEADARINELVDALEEDAAPERREALEELVQLYLARAGRKYEEDEEDARDDFAAAFARADEYLEEYGESVAILQLVANGRLAFAVMLNDEGEFEEADRNYLASQDANEKLIGFGVPGAKLDIAGIRLNRASILIESGARADGFNLFDEAIEEFQRLADADHSDPDPLFYLAKALSSKATYLRDELDEDDFESPEAVEAIEAIKRAIGVYTTLVDSGSSQYRSDLADALLAGVALSPKRDKQDLEDALAALNRACAEYERVVPIEPSACVDLFDAELQRGDLLYQMERKAETIAWCDRLLETFEQFNESDELPLLEGLAVAYQRRALMQKGDVKTQKTIDDLSKAIDLQLRVADSLIGTLKGEDEEEHGCGCGHCGGHGEEEHGCGCGHCGGHDEEEHSCGCGHCGGHDEEHSCGCGHCGGHCGDGDAERRFLLTKWVPDNYNALMEAYYSRALAYLDLRETTKANADCLAADALQKAYKAVLRGDEKAPTSEYDAKLRELKRAF